MVEEMRYFVFLIALFLGCAPADTVKQTVDVVPGYVDVVTSKMNKVETALVTNTIVLQEQTAALRDLKQVIEAIPTSGVEPPRSTTSASEEVPPLVSPPIWETDEYYVQYWGATWCGPCRRMEPKLTKILPTLGLRIVGRFDYDTASPEDRAKSEVVGVPATLLCRRGKIVARIDGDMPERHIKDWFQSRMQR